MRRRTGTSQFFDQASVAALSGSLSLLSSVISHSPPYRLTSQEGDHKGSPLLWTTQEPLAKTRSMFREIGVAFMCILHLCEVFVKGEHRERRRPHEVLQNLVHSI